MTKRVKFLEYLIDNPYATTKQLSEQLDMTEGHVKTLLSKLKASGVATVEKVNGTRKINVNIDRMYNKRVETNRERQEKIELLLSVVIEGIIEERDFSKMLEGGRLAIKLLDRL
ncbi:winged helix-turn-helix domain-containing protein [Carnobacteriaceae bacterium zg-ZUI78]|nr:winged helix-turn-helix domain-containing protein [Carnobacteriaceae bacterium zg-ZUI78]